MDSPSAIISQPIVLFVIFFVFGTPIYEITRIFIPRCFTAYAISERQVLAANNSFPIIDRYSRSSKHYLLIK